MLHPTAVMVAFTTSVLQRAFIENQPDDPTIVGNQANAMLVTPTIVMAVGQSLASILPQPAGEIARGITMSGFTQLGWVLSEVFLGRDMSAGGT